MLIRSVRTAIMLLCLLFMTVTALSVFYLAAKEHRQLYAHYVEGDLDALTDNMASDLVSILSQPDKFFELKTLLLSLDPYDYIAGAAVYDSNWRLVDLYVGKVQQSMPANNRIQFINWPLRQAGIHQQDGQLMAVKMIGDASMTIGYLVVVNDFQGPIDSSTRSLIQSALPMVTSAMLILMIIFSFFGSRWLSPLTHLSSFARRVQKSKDYSLTIPVVGHYEVSSLAQNINNMMGAIRQEAEINQEYMALLEQRRLEMEYLANYDSLTGLVNRQYFYSLLENLFSETSRNNRGFAIMFIDLDGFKLVNDSLGHTVGDQLLVEVAERLKGKIPEYNVISRHGGDEFLVLIRSFRNQDYLSELAEDIVSSLAQTFMIHSWEVRVSASVGIALARDCEGDTQELIRNADVAMYHAKSEGKSRYSFFSAEMMKDHQRRMDIANAIEPALANDEFTLQYQAKVQPDGYTVGAEALIRWHSAQLGFISPAEFIPIAEQSGKITDITQWVVRQTCRDIRNTMSANDLAIPVSVNLSAADLKKPQLIDYIKDTFIKYAIQPGMVDFEVTEHSYLGNLELANQFFADIAAMGCAVALDDFGTGYSSLSYLTKIPINVIKIDKQFVDNIGTSSRDDALVLTIIEMAKRLNMELCAEGVETREQLDFLKEHGCQMIQGYYFSRPLPLTDFVEYAQSHIRQTG